MCFILIKISKLVPSVSTVTILTAVGLHNSRWYMRYTNQPFGQVPRFPMPYIVNLFRQVLKFSKFQNFQFSMLFTITPFRQVLRFSMPYTVKLFCQVIQFSKFYNFQFPMLLLSSPFFRINFWNWSFSSVQNKITVLKKLCWKL